LFGLLIPILLDAAMGTALDRRGVPLLSPWYAASAVEHSGDVVVEIHRDNVQAGAHIITTNTLLAHAGSETETLRLAALAVGLARRAAAAHDRRIRIAGSIGPYPGTASDRAIAYELLSIGLLSAGADLLLVETMTDPAEAALATSAALQVAEGRPVWLAIACDDEGELLDGTLLQLLRRVAIEQLGAVLVNCTSIEGLVPALAMLIPHVPPHVWCGAYPNAGRTIAGRYEPRARTMQMLVDSLVAIARDRSLDVIGGCCGTDADLIAALAAALQPDPPRRDEAWLRLQAAIPRA
jgi:5-methyltetrahydrofolate--homocysteine methyltransferase